MYTQLQVIELLISYTEVLSIIFNVAGILYLLMRDRFEIIVCGQLLFLLSILINSAK